MIGWTSSTQVGQVLRMEERIRIFGVIDVSVFPVVKSQKGPQP